MILPVLRSHLFAPLFFAALFAFGQPAAPLAAHLTSALALGSVQLNHTLLHVFKYLYLHPTPSHSTTV